MNTLQTLVLLFVAVVTYKVVHVTSRQSVMICLTCTLTLY